MEIAAPRAVEMPAWKVSSDGTPVADVTSHREGAGVVVTARLTSAEGDQIRPYRFDDAQAADAFVADLVASFAYLGCHVSRV